MFIPSVPTPHIDAKIGDFAETVLMPGDPLRAEFIAKNFLTNTRLVNNVRSIQGYTGLYKNTAVSVMASGMGMPSIGIYSYELYTTFGVKNILRTGSAGGYAESVKVRDIILAMGACTDSNFASQYCLGGTFAPICDYDLLRTAKDIADERSLSVKIGNVLSSDTFYADEEHLPQAETAPYRWGKMGVLAVEMEAAALYMTAARLHKRALAICTVSDHLLTGEALNAKERQETFTDMIELALETAVKHS